MITNDSRYVSAATEYPSSHTYNTLGEAEKDDDGKLIEVSRATTYLLTTRQTSVPPRQYMVKETDNVQLLAYSVFQDPTQWWVIADANPHIRYPLDLKMGDLIHLPE